MMKVLWLCNIVLPDFSGEFGIRRNEFGGWMTGMLHEMEKRDEVDVSLCFPIFDPERLREGTCRGHRYYTFLFRKEESCEEEMTETFVQILEKDGPDIVHIWGTEYLHTHAMLMACRKWGILEKAVINIQGLVSVCAEHYLTGIPEQYRGIKGRKGISLKNEEENFRKRGETEKESLKTARHVIGRTDWDRACVEAVSPEIQYHFCDEIMREYFYQYAGEWRYEKCEKYRIFVSQASYPVKGFHFLLRALPVILKRFPETRVYVAGADILGAEEKGAYALYLQELIDQFGLEKKITFLGGLDEEGMIQEYLKANVFVSASTIENSPNSLNEAMLIGVPVVASYVGGVPSRMKGGTEGFLYPCDESVLLAYYVCRIFENKDRLCEKMSENAAEKMSKLVDRKLNGNRNMAVYASICNK